MERKNTLKHTTVNKNGRDVVRNVSTFSILLSPFSILLLFAFFFTRCEKDGGGSSKADWFDGKISAKIENGEDSDISKVWALFDAKVNSSGDLTGRMIGDGEFEDGRLEIDLPDVPDIYLINIETFFSSGLELDYELEFSNPDSRVLNVDFYGLSSSGKYVDYFVFTNKKAVCLFVYVDSDVTVKGNKNVTVKFKEGWNRIYWTPASDKVTSTAPSGMKWYLNKDL